MIKAGRQQAAHWLQEKVASGTMKQEDLTTGQKKLLADYLEEQNK